VKSGPDDGRVAEQPGEAAAGRAGSPTGRRPAEALRRLSLGSPAVQSSLTFAAFIAIFVGYGIWLGSLFLNVSARVLDVHQNVPILLLALAALVTLLAGMFDLSIASLATLTTFLSIGLRTKDGLPFWLVLVVCLAVGVGSGLLNGLLVEVLGVNTFIATLGTSGILLGASQVYSSGTQLAPAADGDQLPSWFVEAGLFTQKCPVWLLTVAVVLVALGTVLALERRRPHGMSGRSWLLVRLVGIGVACLALLAAGVLERTREISVCAGFLLVVTLALWVLIQMTTFGRYLKATGSNREAAALAGVPVRGTVVRAFVIGGVLAASAGVVLGSTQGVAVSSVAVPYLLPAFAAAFLSTVVLSTGHFTVWGTVTGGIFLVWVSQGLILGGLPATWTDIVNGAVLVIAVALSTVVRGRRA
jgi:ribose/xylose/arabinose/galactoside ABC-type transport system permease subunit